MFNRREAPTRKREYGPISGISLAAPLFIPVSLLHIHNHFIALSIAELLTISSLARIKALLSQNLQLLGRDTVDQAILLLHSFPGAELRYLGRGHGREEREREGRRGDASRPVLLMRACMTWGRGLNAGLLQLLDRAARHGSEDSDGLRYYVTLVSGTMSAVTLLLTRPHPCGIWL